MIQKIKPCAQSPLYLISKLLVLCLTVGVFVLPASAVAQINTVAETVGPKACADCHKLSVRAWKSSHHFKTFKALPRKSEAKAIAKKMGIK
ncbi:MAG: multiheme c-type cytochrome, partial [Methylococcales bacterium]